MTLVNVAADLKIQVLFEIYIGYDFFQICHNIGHCMHQRTSWMYCSPYAILHLKSNRV